MTGLPGPIISLLRSRSKRRIPTDNLDVQNVQTTGPNSGTSASPNFVDVGNADQGSKINTFNISPTYTRVISNDSVFNLGAFVRKDLYGYYPSFNPLADLGPSNLQTSSISQYRTLTNTGLHADYSYVKGVNNLKIGAQYEQTFLREHDSLGVVDSTYDSPCVDVDGDPLPGYASQADCDGVTSFPNANYLAVLAPYDLTRGGAFYDYFGHTDVKEFALYVEDEIKAGNWDFNLGLREDLYNGLTDANQTEPRVGIAYNIKPSGTVMAALYARTLETPFNENLVLSSSGCSYAALSPPLWCNPGDL